MDKSSNTASDLTPEHLDYLRNAAITDEVIEAAGIRSVTSTAELPGPFTWTGGDGIPAIVFPWRRAGTGEIVLQLRPDRPVPVSDGEAKYLFQKGAGAVLNVHPHMRDRVTDPSVPIVIVEGTKQYLSAVSHIGDGYAVVGIMGCWGWSHDHVPGTDLTQGIPWEGREVITIFDADLASNRKVWEAASALTEVLMTSGAASVRYAKVPATGTAGLDDYLATAVDPAAVLAKILGRAEPKLPRKPARKRGNGNPNGEPNGPNTSGLASVRRKPLQNKGPNTPNGPNASPGDAEKLLDDVYRALIKFVSFPSLDHAVAVTLYAAATHAAASLQVAPRLRIKSPVKRCGKTRLLQVLTPLVASPLPTANISAAALARSIGEDPPTIVMDEMDAVFGKTAAGDEKAETLRGILNAGFDRDAPYIRCSTGPFGVNLETCPTFAMAIIAGIGNLPDTIEDRAVIITMERKTDADQVARFRRRRDLPYLLELGEKLAGWVATVAEAIGEAEPAMPGGLSDRAEDVWEPLVAVADKAGGRWPVLAQTAAARLAGEAADADTDVSTGTRLLADLKDIFGDADAMPGWQVLAKLNGLDESPWGSWNRGKPLDARGLAKLLRPFGVRSAPVWVDSATHRGYKSADLTDAWLRYAGGSVRSVRSVRPPAPQGFPPNTSEDASVRSVRNPADNSVPPPPPVTQGNLAPVPSPYLEPPPPAQPPVKTGLCYGCWQESGWKATGRQSELPMVWGADQCQHHDGRIPWNETCPVCGGKP